MDPINIIPDNVIPSLAGPSNVAKSEFPLEVLPPKMQRIALELLSGCGFPLDYTASAMLAAISVAVGNTSRVEVKRSWQESAIVYMALVGRPGANKSHPLTFAMRPLVNADWKNNQEFQRQYSRYQQAIAMTKKERIEAGFDEYPMEPIRRRCLVSDVTQEGLSVIHAQNPRGVCLVADELATWFKNFNRYNSGSEEQFWLSAFNGKTTMSDRKNSSNSIFIKQPFISVVGTIQRKLLAELANGERASNGFIDRILFATPQTDSKPKWSEDDVRDDLDEEWETLLSRLLGLTFTLDEQGEPQPSVLRFAPTAKKRLFAWQHENADMCETEQSDTVVSFFCKLEIYAIRFSLLLRMARWAASDEPLTPTEIELENVEGAIRLAEYFRRNALEMLTCVSHERLNDLHRAVYDALPNEFATADGIKLAEKFGMREHTFKMFLSRNLNTLFKRMRVGYYRKHSCYSANSVTRVDELQPTGDCVERVDGNEP